MTASKTWHQSWAKQKKQVQTITSSRLFYIHLVLIRTWFSKITKFDLKIEITEDLKLCLVQMSVPSCVIVHSILQYNQIWSSVSVVQLSLKIRQKF